MDEKLYYPNTQYNWGQIEGMMADLILSQKETERRFQETERLLSEKFMETTDQINALRGHYDKQLGKLVEGLINKNTIRLFKNSGIKINRSIPNPVMDFENQSYEFDSFLLNGNEMVVIEAKVTLTSQLTNKFHKKMTKFKTYYTEYKNFKVYPCMAYISVKGDAKSVADSKGIFLLEMKDKDHFEFGNSQGFVPKPL